jgi:Cd2+/Zn2+-exporting ATPase
MPRHVKIGDELYAGTINTDDPIEAEVLRAAAESSLARILNLVTKAREQREPVQRVIDRVSQPYAISVMVASVAVLLVWWLVMGVPLRGDDNGPGALYTAITLLIVASPCALIIATPTATLSAIARGARAGVLFKGGQAIERLANVGSVCFDKTGTLTFGRPRVYEVHPVAWSDGNKLLAIAAGIEGESAHPIAAAIREVAALRGIAPEPVEEYDHVAGRGVAARYHGCPVRLGSYRFTEELIPVCFRQRVTEVLERIQERGHLGVVVAHACPQRAGGGEVAVIIMADAVRPGARTLVERLHAMGVKPVRMLTGDNRLTAERVAAGIGIDRVDAELLPEDKVAAVVSMKADAAQGRRGVAVIGDGVNDAPAMAAADASVAIGSIGSEAALESADIVLLSDDLSVVPWAIGLARRARATVKANLAFALSVIAVMAVATLVGSRIGHDVPLSAGVLAHEGGTLLVVFNSLRLLWVRGVGGEGESAAPARVREPATVAAAA